MPDQLAHTNLKIYSKSIFLMIFIVTVIAASAASSIESSLIDMLISTCFWMLVYGAATFGSYSLSKNQNRMKLCEDAAKACAILGMLLFIYSLLSDPLVQSLLILLLWLQAATLFQIKSEREIFISLSVAFTLVLFSASLSKSGFFLVYLFAFSLLAFLNLILLFDQSQKSNSHVGQSSSDNTLFNWHLLGLGLLIFTLALVTYFITPKLPPLEINGFIQSGLNEYDDEDWEKEAKDSDSTKGRDSKNDMVEDGKGQSANSSQQQKDRDDQGQKNVSSQLGEESIHTQDDNTTFENSSLAENYEPKPEAEYSIFDEEVFINKQFSDKGIFRNAIVMYMQASEPLYLRGRTLNRFSGYSWSDSLQQDEKLLLSFNRYEFKEQPDNKRAHLIEVAIELSDRIYAAEQKIAVEFPGTVISQSSDGSIAAPKNLSKGTSYKIEYLPQLYAGRSFIDANLTNADSYLELPVGFDEKIRKLAQGITQNETETFQKILTLETHLRTEYNYDLDTVFTSQGVTPLSSFLFETKKGHCEYFASAMAIMLRSLDIPSRLVTGYSATQYNPITGYYEVRALHGHAWVEAYINEVGWVTFEPTPAFLLPEPRVVKSTSQEIQDYLEDLVESSRKHNAEDSEINFAAEALNLLQNAKLIIKRIYNLVVDIVQAISDSLKENFGYILGLLMLALGILWFRSYFIEAIHIAKWAKLKNLNSTLSIQSYEFFENWFSRRGFARQYPEDLKAYALRLSDEYPDLKDGIHLVCRYAEISFYGSDETQRPSADEVVEAIELIIRTTKFKFYSAQPISMTVH